MGFTIYERTGRRARMPHFVAPWSFAALPKGRSELYHQNKDLLKQLERNTGEPGRSIVSLTAHHLESKYFNEGGPGSKNGAHVKFAAQCAKAKMTGQAVAE
jgi:hypothetical protein